MLEFQGVRRVVTSIYVVATDFIATHQAALVKPQQVLSPTTSELPQSATQNHFNAFPPVHALTPRTGPFVKMFIFAIV